MALKNYKVSGIRWYSPEMMCTEWISSLRVTLCSTNPWGWHVAARQTARAEPGVWQQGDKLLLSGRGAETHQGQGWKGQVKHSLKEDAEVFYLLIPAKTLVVYNCLEDMFHKDSQSLLECCEKWKSHLTLEVCSSPSSSQSPGEPASLEAKYKDSWSKFIEMDVPCWQNNY